MNVLIALLLSVTIPAQPAVTLPEDAGMAPPPMLAAPQQAGAEAAQEVSVEIIALKGAQRGHGQLVYGEELKPFAEVLEALTPNDDFALISREKKPLPMGQETQYPVNGLYTAHVTAHGAVEAPEGGQRFDIEMRIADLSGAEPIDALRARGEAAAGEAIILRGMPLGQDELIVLVLVSSEGGEGGGGEQSEAESAPEGESENKPQPQEPEGASEGEGEEESPPPLDAEDEGESEAEESPEAQNAEQQPEGESGAQEGPQDMETIKALLESLEQKDREEQKNAHHRRSEVKIRGDWW